MEEILRRGNLRLVLEGTHHNLSQPRAFAQIHLHIHRINLLSPGHRLSDVARFQRDTHFSSVVPLLLLLNEDTRNRAMSVLISRVSTTDRSSAESAKQVISQFVRKMAFLSLQIPTGTLEIKVHLSICKSSVYGAPSVPKLVKFAGGMGGDEARQNCAICLEDFQEGAEIMSLPCNHAFHGECMEKWMRAKRSCPLCRFEF